MSLRKLTMLAAVLGLSACASVDTATRNAPGAIGVAAQAPAAAPVIVEPLNVTSIKVRVPETLAVSEANTYLPKEPIVWREDPFGNRHEQVRVIVQAAADRAAANHVEGRGVVVDIMVSRFHALTERTRYSIGGTHDLHYFVTFFDAETGAQLSEPQYFERELKAFGGARALEAMSRGQTQKVRITDFLSADFDQVLRTSVLPTTPTDTLLSQL